MLGLSLYTTTEDLGLAIRAVVAEIMLRCVEQNPVEIVFALNCLYRFRSIANDARRIVTPTGALSGDRDSIAEFEGLQSWRYRVFVAHIDPIPEAQRKIQRLPKAVRWNDELDDIAVQTRAESREAAWQERTKV
jgi:hypothetical protein